MMAMMIPMTTKGVRTAAATLMRHRRPPVPFASDMASCRLGLAETPLAPLILIGGLD